MKKLILFTVLSFYFLSGHSQEQIFVSTQGGEIYSFNLANCSFTVISQSGIEYVDIALTPDGNLWGKSFTSLYHINTQTGLPTLIGPIGPFQNGNAMEALNNSTLVYNHSELRALNVNNTTNVPMGWIQYAAAGDIAWYNNDLYMTGAAYLIKITLNAPNTYVTSVTIVNQSNGIIPPCQGLITAEFPGSPNALVGFGDGVIYKFCPIDASYEIICTHNLGVLSGAAATRLPIQNMTTNDCSSFLATSHHEVNESNIIIYPNPVDNSDKFFIKAPDLISLPITARIKNILGVTLFSQVFDNRNIEIDLFGLNLSSGTYIVETSSLSGNVTSFLLVK